MKAALQQAWRLWTEWRETVRAQRVAADLYDVSKRDLLVYEMEREAHLVAAWKQSQRLYREWRERRKWNAVHPTYWEL